MISGNNDVEELKETALHFINYITSDIRKSEDDRLRTFNLIHCLDRLSLCMQGKLDFDFDNADYPEPPDFDYALYYQTIKSNFPAYSDYNFVTPNTDNKSDILISDPIDDLTDIYNDVRQFIWRLENTSLADALFDLDLSCRSHWGRHVRNLQSYLHMHLYDS